MTDKLINSHIQIPRCILRQFENEKNHLFYYDKNKTGKNPIKKSNSKSLNTAPGYYSQTVETILSKEVETSIGNVLKYINSSGFPSKTNSIPAIFETTIKTYARALLYRSDLMLSEMNKGSEYFSDFGKQEQHDLAICIGSQLAESIEIFKNTQLTFAINYSENPFVLPLYGVFLVKAGEYEFFGLPLTPKVSAVLADSNWFKKRHDINEFPLFTTSDGRFINQINRIGINFELSKGRGICVSNDKEYLFSMVSEFLKK